MTTKKKSKKINNSFTEKEKVQVVKWFAEFNTPTQVTELVAEHFNKKRERNTLECYRSGKKWVALFNKYRNEFLEDISSIPYANKAVRVRTLNKLIDRLLDAVECQNKGWLFAVDRLLAALEQIAKEAGDIETKTEVNIYQLIAERAREREIDLNSLSKPSINFEVSKN